MCGFTSIWPALAKTGFSLFLLVLILYLVASPADLLGDLFAAEPLFLLLAFAGSLAGVGIQWRKWHALLASIRPATRAAESLRSLLVGFSLGMASPGRVGELGRGALFEGLRVEAVALAGIDRACSAGVTLAVGILGLGFIFPPAFLACGAGLAVAGGLLFRHGEALPSILRKRTGSGPWGAAAGRLSTALGSISKSLLLRVLLWSLLFNLIFFVQFYLLAMSWIELPPQGIAAIPVVFGLKTLLPVGFLDLGPREAASALVFSSIGLDPVPAVNAALLLWLLNLALPAIAGGVWMSVEGAGRLFGEKRAIPRTSPGGVSPVNDGPAPLVCEPGGTGSR